MKISEVKNIEGRAMKIATIRIRISKPNLMHLHDYYYKMHKADKSNGSYYVDVLLPERPWASVDGDALIGDQVVDSASLIGVVFVDDPFIALPPEMVLPALLYEYASSLNFNHKKMDNDLNWFKFLVKEGFLPELIPRKKS